jgi:hypothetical protein
MGVQIVQNHMNLPAWMGVHQFVHEIQKLAAAARTMTRRNLAAGHIQGRKERTGAVAGVIVLKTAEGLTAGQTQPALLPFQSLNAGLFIDGKDQCMVGRCQIQAQQYQLLSGQIPGRWTNTSFAAAPN